VNKSLIVETLASNSYRPNTDGWRGVRSPAGRRYRDSRLIGGSTVDVDLAAGIEARTYIERFTVSVNPICCWCTTSLTCGKGCTALVVSRDSLIGAVDTDRLPVVPRARLALRVPCIEVDPS